MLNGFFMRFVLIKVKCLILYNEADINRVTYLGY